MTNVTEFRCLHCSANVFVSEIKDGWCDSCGKKVPYSIQCEAKKMGAFAVRPKDDYDEPKPGSGRRLLMSGLVVVSFVVVLAVAAFKLV